MAQSNNSNLLSSVLNSIFFRRSNSKAARYIRSSKSLFSLIQRVGAKSSSLGVSGGFAAVRDQLNLLVRMVRAYAKGEYRDISKKSLLSVVAALIYFVSPIDLVFDFLPIIGFADDVALLIWVVKSIEDELGKFSQWEKNSKSIKIG